MKKLFLLFLMFFSVWTFSACTTDANEPEHKSQFVEKSLSSGRYLYTVALPENYSANDTLPLIVALHYGVSGEAKPYVGREFLEMFVEPSLRGLRSIMIAPDCPAGGNWMDKTSEQYVLMLIDSIKKDYKIYPKKIVLTGYSMGGRGTWYLAGNHQDIFSCGIIVAGEPPEMVYSVDWKIPLYIIHGRLDVILPIEKTDEAVRKLTEKGVSIEYIVLDDAYHSPATRYILPLKLSISWIVGAWGKG
ncbi:MAG: dienelactone hydrolase family protein [bacterium]